MVHRAGLRVLDSSSVLTGHVSSAARSGGPQPHRRLVGHAVFDRRRPSAVGRSALAPPILRCTGEGSRDSAPVRTELRAVLPVGAVVVWRCHVGTDGRNEHTEAGWSFLRPYLEAADAFVFSRRSFAPDWIPAEKVITISPSLDPFSPKNQEVEPQIVRQALVHAGLLVGPPESAPVAAFCRRDGSPGRVDRHADVLHSGPPAGSGRAAGGAGVPVGPDEGHDRGDGRLHRAGGPTLRRAAAAGRPGGHGGGRRPGRRAGPRRVRGGVAGVAACDPRPGSPGVPADAGSGGERGVGQRAATPRRGHHPEKPGGRVSG